MTKKKEDSTFDWMNAINELDLLEIMKAGLTDYILNNKLNPKDTKELNKIINDYKKLPIGA